MIRDQIENEWKPAAKDEEDDVNELFTSWPVVFPVEAAAAASSGLMMRRAIKLILSELFNLVPHVRINFRVDYILRKIVGGRIVEETVCSTHRCFYIRLFLITQFDFYMHMICVPDEDEYCQVRQGLEYDIQHPETFLFKFLSCHGVNDKAFIHKFVDDTKDFVTKLRTKAFDMIGWRAIMPDPSHVELGDKLIKLLSTPPPYKFLIELENDRHQMNCGTCSGKLRFQDYIFFLPCSHAYHHSCIAHWAKRKIQCQVCLEYVDFRNFLECAVLRTRDSGLN
ncbi:RING/U-box superfamily protein [Striga asiatica]|uniref:RING/U-box superfamily protein n=1 Tax=Striga asiatica TaxID=4170 RepID=A0A5A7R343_STRAF|nr:RING/U-box superfamily protein [Striga asiatica]